MGKLLLCATVLTGTAAAGTLVLLAGAAAAGGARSTIGHFRSPSDVMLSRRRSRPDPVPRVAAREIGTTASTSTHANASSRLFASCRPAISNPWVNQP